MSGRRKTPTTQVPLSESYRVSDASGCWIWIRSFTHGGYGRVRMRDRRGVTLAHRVVWQELVGPIPHGLHLDHLCRVRACVNPEHLELVTPAENNRRAAALRTQCRNGHPLDGRRPGHRYCLTCHRDNQRRYLARKGADLVHVA